MAARLARTKRSTFRDAIIKYPFDLERTILFMRIAGKELTP